MVLDGIFMNKMSVVFYAILCGTPLLHARTPAAPVARPVEPVKAPRLVACREYLARRAHQDYLGKVGRVWFYLFLIQERSLSNAGKFKLDHLIAASSAHKGRHTQRGYQRRIDSVPVRRALISSHHRELLTVLQGLKEKE